MLTVVPGDGSGHEGGKDGSPSLIDEIVREGARRMLAEALQAEVHARQTAGDQGGQRLPYPRIALDGHQPRLPRLHQGDDRRHPVKLRLPAHKMSSGARRSCTRAHLVPASDVGNPDEYERSRWGTAAHPRFQRAPGYAAADRMRRIPDAGTGAGFREPRSSRPAAPRPSSAPHPPLTPPLEIS
jgi:hypothetical protein